MRYWGIRKYLCINGIKTVKNVYSIILNLMWVQTDEAVIVVGVWRLLWPFQYSSLTIQMSENHNER